MEKKQLNDLYDYGLKIYQNPDYFKFSLDSILLSEFTKIHKKDKIIDLCTGNAPVPLILSTKYDNEIYGVEIQEELFNYAKESVEYNKKNQIKLINDNIKNLKNYFPGNNFDIITCNPPYFRYNETGYLNLEPKKALARHELTMNIDDLCEIMNYLLKNNGTIYMVYNAQRLFELSIVLAKYNIFIKKVVFVITNNSKEYNIVLIKATKDGKKDAKLSYIDVRNLKTYQNIF